MVKKTKKGWSHQVRQEQHKVRIVDYCGLVFDVLGSKSATKKAISAGRITINGQKATTANFVNKGDLIELTGTGIRKIKAYETDLDIVFEDQDIVIVNKAGGIAVNGNRFKTIENALVNKAKKSTRADALPRPVAIHRIDVPTKGLVMFAKTKSTLIQLGKSFQENEVQKKYVAIVHGQPEQSGVIKSPIDGKPAETKYETLQIASSLKYQHLSLVQLKPVTGRTHQLRIHLNQIGHLIVGDKQYAGDQETILGKGLFLCSCMLAFTHPFTKKQERVIIEPPRKFIRLLEREQERFDLRG